MGTRGVGPKDFTHTFEQFEFKPGGRWVLVMHGPNGANYPNEGRRESGSVSTQSNEE
jgi:uncharacterized protein YndB with AHSA1/START domain